MRLEDLEIPENPGPAILEKEPLFGSFRRNLGLPVLRDMARNRTHSGQDTGLDGTTSEEIQTQNSTEQSSNSSTENQTTNAGIDIPEIDF